MFAGPNGAGKTTLVHKLACEFSPDGLFQLHQFINADELFVKLRSVRGIQFADFGLTVSWGQLRSALLAGGRLTSDHPFFEAAQVVDSSLTAPAATCDAYVAASLADFLREELLAASRSFSFETVMSHKSKVDFFARARVAGYRTYLYFVATESPVLNIHRIEARAELGGHAVPEQKIVDRYDRCLALVGDALACAHRAFLFDNSGVEPIWLAQLNPDREFELKVSPSALPMWFQRYVAPRYTRE